MKYNWQNLKAIRETLYSILDLVILFTHLYLLNLKESFAKLLIK